MFSPQDDPLGLGLQQRARDRRWKDVVNGTQQTIGPLQDPHWDALFQAVGESAKGRPVKFGLSDPEINTQDTNPVEYARQTRALNQASPFAATLQEPSKQLGAPLSLRALHEMMGKRY